LKTIKIQQDMKNNILELYTAIQSEGSRAGKPTIVIRTSGCTHRCFFKKGGWCDSWYTSIHPEKSTYNFDNVVEMYDKNPHIKEMMITGGSPTMHPELLEKLTAFAHHRKIITTIETEGSHFIETKYKIDLISLSPKFSNSIPTLDTETPKGKIVNQAMIDQHNKYRLNYKSIAQMLSYHSDYHLKPVWDGKDKKTLDEIIDFINLFKIPNDKVWLMPAGDTRKALTENYAPVMEKCIEMGWNFSPRPHIIAYDDKRGV
jgi:7-carboxy-7-deazaguanine synthase